MITPVKKALKITAIILGILVVLFTGFHFWFRAHAKKMLEQIVDSKSNGKLKMKIDKFSYGYFSNKMELKNVVFFNTDTLTATTAYRFHVARIELEVQALLPIIFQKQLLIDSLYLIDPHIQVTRLKEDEKEEVTKKKDVSIPEEMGKVYESIQDALKVLQVDRFQIVNGTFRLVNKIIPDQLPITITNIHFQIDNLQVDTSKSRASDKILFSDNVALRSYNQDILFPDGRHRLSFSNFKINLARKLVQFDSCTISATRGDSSDASFSVFFDALMLTNIDFDTLYKSEVIKADSVYCVNPRFNLSVETGKKKENGDPGGKSKPPPKLEDLVKQLTGDLLLAHVIVSNADFNITTTKNGVPSTFTFTDNNFEMRGLSVDQKAKKPLKVESFAMAIRNYENFIKDSSYSIRFDSVLFRDDKITLSNFIFNKLEKGKIINTFSIPQFNLQGLSWDALVFDKQLKAEQAQMFSPTISYTVNPAKARRADKQTIFQSLGAMNEYMDLKYLDVIDGNIDLKLKNNLRVQLEQANLSVQSNSLLTSTKISGIKNSLTNLNFKNGRIQAGNLVIELNDIHYVGQSGQFGAGNILVTDKKKNLSIALREVAVGRMQVDEVSGSIYADDVAWKDGSVNISSLGGSNSDEEGVIILRNVQGGRTIVNATVGRKNIKTTLERIYFEELVKRPGNKLQLAGLDIKGNELNIKDDQMRLGIESYDITDNNTSIFQNIKYTNNSSTGSADIKIPNVTLIPRIQALLNGSIALDNILVLQPDISIKVGEKKPTPEQEQIDPFVMNISSIRLAQPKINVESSTDSNTLIINWDGNRNNLNFLEAYGITRQGNSLSVNDLKFYLSNFTIGNSGGRQYSTGEGNVSAHLARMQLISGIQPEWHAVVSMFEAKDLRLGSIGNAKSNFVMKTGKVSGLQLSSTTVNNLQKLIAANQAFEINKLTGSYNNENANIHWQNAGFNRSNKTFTVDSFSYKPTLPVDSFLATKEFQTDYITVSTGKITIGPTDFDDFINNNKLNIGTAIVNDLRFTDYKDKNLPFNQGIIKPLPVNILKKIPMNISLRNLLLKNAQVEYTEKNNKTNAVGTITVTRMDVRLLNAKNYNIAETDSLTIQATGYLLDSVWMQLHVKESYTDSLGGFLTTLRVKPADLTILNPALVSLASIELKSGILDTLTMRAVGREYLAMGEMEMFYHDLKINLLKADGESKRGFLSALANLLVKNKNTSRKATVFFVRQRDKSAINYLIKIAMSGMASTVGIKSSKKMMKKYRKQLIKRDLPPIDLE